MKGFEGVIGIVQKFSFKFTLLAVAAAGLFAAACGGSGSSGGAGTAGAGDAAARVNSKTITMEEVDRAVKQQAGGEDSKMSQLELAGARLQVLQSLIEQEVMFQKAEKEGTVPTEEEITTEINKQKNQSGKSSDQIDKDMKEAGVTDASLRDSVKKAIAIQKLVEKITGKIEAPGDAEIDAYYNGNKSAFVKKKGVKLAAIVIDPSNSGEGDATIDEASAVQKGNEIIKKIQAGQEFSALAREYSEDQSKFQGGDLGYISEDEMKQSFPAQVVASLMNPQFEVGKIITAPMQGKFYIFKLQERSDKDEAVTLETPGIRQQVIESITNNRKQLLAASYQAVAMNEAKIENFLAKKVVENPNELSGARPAPAAGDATPAPTANANTNANSPAANAVSANANKPAANAIHTEANKPSANVAPNAAVNQPAKK